MRTRNRLSPSVIGAANLADGWHCDGGGLYLYRHGAGRSYVFRYDHMGKRRHMGLGATDTVTLAAARKEAGRLRGVLASGIDPLAAREDARRAEAAAAAREYTFAQAVEDTIAAKRAEWKNAKHAGQWKSTLATYALKTLGDKRVEDIGTQDVFTVLKPIWAKKTETARRVRQRIEAALDYAYTVKQFALRPLNPARWDGNLENLLAKPGKIAKVEHHEAIPFAEIPALVAKLRGKNTVSARALLFTLLTAARSGEVRGGHMGEVANSLWTIPADRMKAAREHTIPLSADAASLLPDAGVFFRNGGGLPLSDAAMRKYLQQDMGHSGATVHGFRSSFRDWISEKTNFPHEIAEMALAHTIKNKAEAAYRRGDLLEKRRELMQAWADYCFGR